MTTSPATGGAGSGARLAAVLAVFAELPSPSVEDIRRATGVPASAVYRHLATLIDAGLVTTTGTRGRYCAGPRSVQMAGNYRRHVLSQGAVARRLAQLAEDTGELAAFLIPSGDRVLCVEAAEGAEVVRCCFSSGASRPLIRGASAQALLAHLPTARVRELATRYGLDPIEWEKLDRELALVRERGHATSVGMLDQGVWGVSVPVLDAKGALLATISTMAPEFRVRSRHDHLVTLTRAAAADVARLKHPAP
ncbi:IclR family transcriptional regulator [Streptomyces sp. BBFR102]|uniref:IclR family transcriptional regulator n=1 Tax=Streptomyces sp. BBFR102 TaxID=3448171 RepID=UPI003F5298FE